MTDKELRKLKRADLLEILVAQSKEIDRLREQVKKARILLAEQRDQAPRSSARVQQTPEETESPPPVREEKKRNFPPLEPLKPLEDES